MNKACRFTLSSLVFLLVLPASSAHAFHLADHENITRQAVAEFQMCFPNLPALDVQALVEANLDEDTNLIRKELHYSHYYSPIKTFGLGWRVGSLQRVRDIGVKPVTSDDLGHEMHHLQDAAVPAHVVPISHGFNDGFENFVVPPNVPSGWNCDDIRKSAARPEQILRETALETLTSLDIAYVEVNPAHGTGPTVVLDANDFWSGAKQPGWGSYGPAGDIFGSPDVEVNGQTYAVPVSFYTMFKRHQVELAVRSSLRLLMWSRGPR